MNAGLDIAVAALEEHPCFDRCTRVYRNGLLDWNASGAIQQAARTLGMDRRAYCDARLAANEFQWFASGTGDSFTRAHVEWAWQTALNYVGGTTTKGRS